MTAKTMTNNPTLRLKLNSEFHRTQFDFDASKNCSSQNSIIMHESARVKNATVGDENQLSQNNQMAISSAANLIQLANSGAMLSDLL